MLTILKSNRSGGISVRTSIVDRTTKKLGLDWQHALRKLTLAFTLGAAVVGAGLAEAAITQSIPVTIQAESFSAAGGTRNYTTSNGAIYVGAISTGDWMNYLENKVVIPVSGQYTISYRVSSPYSGSTFLFNNVGGSISKVDRISVPRTGGWEKWVTVERTVTLKAGPHTFGIKATVGGFNINWFSITTANTTGSKSSTSSTASSKSSVSSSLAVSSVVSSSKAASSIPRSSKASVSSALAVISSSSRVASVPASSSSAPKSSLASSSKMSSSKVSSSKASSVSSSISSSKISSSSSSSAVSSASSLAAGYTQVAGSVGLTWIAPTLREDKTELDITELGGYQIRYKSMTDSKYIYITINDAWATDYSFSWLEGAYIFEIAAFDKSGVLSDFSSFTD